MTFVRRNSKDLRQSHRKIYQPEEILRVTSLEPLDSLWSLSKRLTMGLPAAARPGHSLAEAESWQRPQTGRLYEDPEDTEGSVAHRS